MNTVATMTAPITTDCSPLLRNMSSAMRRDVTRLYGHAKLDLAQLGCLVAGLGGLREAEREPDELEHRAALVLLLREDELEERVEGALGIGGIVDGSHPRLLLREAMTHRRRRELAQACEHLLVRLVRILAPPKPHDELHFHRIPRPNADPRVENEVVANAIGDDHLLAGRSVNLEPCFDEGLLDFLGCQLIH
jgi:hypothetical protein